MENIGVMDQCRKETRMFAFGFVCQMDRAPPPPQPARSADAGRHRGKGRTATGYTT
jgi:hypothetical protein